VIYISYLESKEYHDKIEKQKSWLNIAKATLNDFDKLEATEQKVKSKYLS